MSFCCPIFSRRDKIGQFQEHGEITITRDAAGNPTAIISPYGHRTGLAVDSEGNLTKIAFEDGTGYSFGYTSDGLMTSMTNPRGLISTHRFDDAGHVIGIKDPSHHPGTRRQSL